MVYIHNLVIEFNSYLVTKLPSVFTRLPGGQDMRVAWRETLRPGKKFGSRIEDVGVTADFIVRPQVKDFNPYATTFTYFETIAEKLIEIGKESDSLDLNCTITLT